MPEDNYVAVCIHRCRNCAHPCRYAQILFVPKLAGLE